MTINNGNTGVNVGVDVGKFQLDIFIWERDRHFTVENTEDGIREAIKILNRYRIDRIAMEATGRYEMAFAAAAFERDLPVTFPQS